MVNAIGKCPGGAAVPIGANYVPVASDGSSAPSSTAFQWLLRKRPFALSIRSYAPTLYSIICDRKVKVHSAAAALWR